MGTSKEDVDEPANLHVTEIDGQADAQEQPAETKTEHDREAGWGDYFRVFTYAKKWDYVLMVAAGVASIGAGIVSPPMP